MNSLNLKELEYMDCGCPLKNMKFRSETLVKKVSAIVSPTGKNEIVPIDIMVCSECGKIPEFIEEKLKDDVGDIPASLKVSKISS